MLMRSYAIFLRQYYLIKGSMARILPLFIWVAVDMVLWGFLTRYLNTVAESKINFIPVLLGAILFWHFLMRTMQGVALAFCEDIWSRNLLNVFATPMSLPEYLGGLIATSIVTSLLGLLVMLFVTSLFFGLSFATFGLQFIPSVLILFIFGITLGILGTAVILRLGPSSEWLVWPIPAIISPFSGVFYPVSTLPDWMEGVSHIIPTSYVFENMRSIIQTGRYDTDGFLISAVLSIIYLCLACVFYLFTYNRAIRSGLIARYSSEGA